MGRLRSRGAHHRTDDLRLRYVLHGALDGMRLPPPGALRRGDRLWEHTCSEAFVAADGVRRSGLRRAQLLAVARMGARTRSRPTARPAPLAASRARAADRRAARARCDRARRPRRVGRSLGLVSRRRPPRRLVGGRRGDERPALVLGARAIRAAARLPSPGRLSSRSRRRRAADADEDDRAMKFGIDRLLADRRSGAPLAGRRARPARASGIGHARPRALARCARGAAATSRVTAAFGPQHGLRGDKQDNMVESPDFDDPVHGIPGLQPLRRRAPADRRDARRVRRPARRPAGRRLAHLHLRHDAALRARSGGGAHGRRCGCSTGRTRSAARSRDSAPRRAGRASSARAPLPMRHGLTLGELARWFVRTLRLDVELRGRRRWKAGSPRDARASAGRSASARGSTRARTRRASRWRAAIPAP